LGFEVYRRAGSGGVRPPRGQLGVAGFRDTSASSAGQAEDMILVHVGTRVLFSLSIWCGCRFEARIKARDEIPDPRKRIWLTLVKAISTTTLQKRTVGSTVLRASLSNLKVQGPTRHYYY